MIFRSVLVVDFIVLMIDFICLEKENDLKVRRVPYCDTNTCVSLKSRTVPYFCWYCAESLFKQLSLICVLATFFYIFWEMMLISLFKKNLGWFSGYNLGKDLINSIFYLSWIGAQKKWQLYAFAKNNSMKARVCATNNRVHAK